MLSLSKDNDVHILIPYGLFRQDGRVGAPHNYGYLSGNLFGNGGYLVSRFNNRGEHGDADEPRGVGFYLLTQSGGSELLNLTVQYLDRHPFFLQDSRQIDQGYRHQ